MRRPWLLGAMVALGLSACVTVNKSVLMDRSSAPVPASQVYVYFQEDELPADCQRVAILNAEGADGWTNESQMFDKLREEAGKLGGNAIQMRGMEDPGTGERVVSALFGTASTRDGEAVALWCPSEIPPQSTAAPDTSRLTR